MTVPHIDTEVVVVSQSFSIRVLTVQNILCFIQNALFSVWLQVTRNLTFKFRNSKSSKKTCVERCNLTWFFIYLFFFLSKCKIFLHFSREFKNQKYIILTYKLWRIFSVNWLLKLFIPDLENQNRWNNKSWLAPEILEKELSTPSKISWVYLNQWILIHIASRPQLLYETGEGRKKKVFCVFKMLFQHKL